MNLRDLIWMDMEDRKKLEEIDKHFEKFRGLDDAMLDQKEELRKLAEAGEIEQNPLAAYSTTELKKELRRRKGKLK